MSDRGDRNDRDRNDRGGRGERGDRTGISLLVRNVSRRLRAEDLRKEFERFGDVRDVYIPKDFRTREAKGFAFVEFKMERDANDARAALDGMRIDGREIRVVFAQERRKTTDQMRERERAQEQSLALELARPWTPQWRAFAFALARPPSSAPQLALALASQVALGIAWSLVTAAFALPASLSVATPLPFAAPVPLASATLASPLELALAGPFAAPQLTLAVASAVACCALGVAFAVAVPRHARALVLACASTRAALAIGLAASERRLGARGD